jgi:hypothetical protein
VHYAGDPHPIALAHLASISASTSSASTSTVSTSTVAAL